MFFWKSKMHLRGLKSEKHKFTCSQDISDFLDEISTYMLYGEFKKVVEVIEKHF